MQGELVADGRAVCLNRPHADEQRVGDLFRSVALGNQPEDLPLSVQFGGALHPHNGSCCSPIASFRILKSGSLLSVGALFLTELAVHRTFVTTTTCMRSLSKLLSSVNGVASLVGLAALLIYLKTLAPSVTFVDAGELAAVACTLGIAHPTGYPLFTLLGWLFSKLPIASEEIVRLNMMAAFFCAAGVFVFYHLAHVVLSGVFGTPNARKKADNVVACRVASAGAALLLAFSETYWSQAVAVEVYALHVFFLSLVTFTFLRAVLHDEWFMGERQQSGSTRWWYLFAFALGLSFTNHMTTILLAPGFLYLYFATQGFGQDSWKRITRLLVPFLLGFSVYLYLPLRASHAPVLNWGNPVTLEKFLWHWTGKQYRVWIFSSTEVAGRQLQYFLASLPYEFAYVGVLLAIAGIMLLWRGNKQLAITLLLLFLGCVFYSINYDIHDIDSYFLLAYFCIALAGSVGLLWLFRWVSEKLDVRAASFTVIAVSLLPCLVHFSQTDETKNYLVEDYTMNMFNSLQPNALVLSYQWDYWVSASYYYQHVKGVRPDVVVVDKELLRRSWYFKQLEHQHPWLIANSRAEVDAFLKELEKFEHDRPYHPAVIQARFVEMIKSFITKNMNDRPVYVTTEIEQEFTRGLQRVPEGLALRLYADTLQHVSRPVAFTYRPFERNGRLEDALKNMYANAYTMQGVNYVQCGKLDSAAMAFRAALTFNPNSSDAVNWLRQVNVMVR